MGWKSGKTRAWKEIIELHYPNEPEAGLLLAFEDGYETWELNSVVPMHNYNWEYFKDTIIPDLVNEAKTGEYITKVIGIDTADVMLSIAEEWILKDAGRRYGKTFKTLSQIQNDTNGKENGYVLLQSEVTKQLNRLKRAGYGFIWLAWTKEKETDLIDGMKYQSLELSMSNTGRKIFESQADLICCLYNEVKVMDKEGSVLSENVKSKSGKDIASKFHSTTAYMYFRPNNYISISGGRFLSLPEKVEYSAQNFLNVFTEAVKGQITSTDKTIDELKTEEKNNRIEKAKVISEEDNMDEIMDEIMNIANNLVKNEELKDKVVQIVGSGNYPSVKEAKEVLKSLKAI